VIEILNPDRKSKGIKEVMIDGKPHKSNLLPVFGDGADHQVKVVIG
jgi:cellobiose phosphorylase